MTMNPFIKRAEAANYLGLSPATLALWALRGDGPVFHKFGSAVRYRIEDLDIFACAARRRHTHDATASREGLTEELKVVLVNCACADPGHPVEGGK
jgi:hypothetical protein